MYFFLFLLLFFFFHFFFNYFFISGNAAFFAAYTQTKIFVLRIGENEIEKNRDRYNKKKNYNSNKIVEYSSNDNLSKEDSLRSIRSIQGKGSVQSSVQGSVYPTSSLVEENRRKGRSVQILENKIEKNIVFDAEVEKKNLREKNNNKAVLLAGAMAGLAYVLSAHPLEIASILMQTDVPIQCPQLQHQLQLQLQLSTVVQKLKMKNLPKYR